MKDGVIKLHIISQITPFLNPELFTHDNDNSLSDFDSTGLNVYDNGYDALISNNEECCEAIMENNFLF